MAKYEAERELIKRNLSTMGVTKGAMKGCRINTLRMMLLEKVLPMSQENRQIIMRAVWPNGMPNND